MDTGVVVFVTGVGVVEVEVVVDPVPPAVF